MPEAQLLAGCKHHSSKKPCRSCHVTKWVDLGNVEFDCTARRRTLWHVREEREKARNSGREPSDEGLAVVAPSPLEECIFDTMTQIPPDPLHAELLGIGFLSISELTKSLTGKTLQELNRNLAILWASAPWKEKCPVLALSQRGKVKLNAEQVARVFQLLPFALSWPDNGRVGQWLNAKSFTKSFAKVAHADFAFIQRFLLRLSVWQYPIPLCFVRNA